MGGHVGEEREGARVDGREAVVAAVVAAAVVVEEQKEVVEVGCFCRVPLDLFDG